MSAIAFALAFLLGRLGSVLLYQAAWAAGKPRRYHAWGAFATFLGKPWPWLAHIPIFALSLGLGLDWNGLPGARVYVWLAAGALAMGAVGRMGAVDLKRLFLFDRILIAALWCGLWFSPAFLYPLLLACCCLQYTVSGWTLNPGYSNLLGFEFMRSTMCMVLAALLVSAGFRVAGTPMEGGETWLFSLVLCGQAAGYFQQAVAKSALGKSWYSWILENRLQCLPVNAWLRGWCASWIRKDGILRLARWVGRMRVPLCTFVWLAETGWLLILLDGRLAVGILAATMALHLAVWLLTGLAGYHYLISHGLMLVFFAAPVSGPEYAWVGGICILISSLWVLLLRRHLFGEYARTGAPGPWGRAVDPADHLMAWWDGPYMRMYSYSVLTAAGRRYRFPVTCFSPYDTFLTDIHTHLMILGRDWGIDPQIAADREFARTGVWGLTVSPADRDRLYRLMDGPAELSMPGAPGPRDESIHRADPSFAAFFQGFNHYQSKWWFRLLWRWPHFPGEDHVPDWSPLAAERLPDYKGEAPVTELICHRVKTFYDGGAIRLLDERVFARIRIPAPSREDIP